MSKSAPNGEKEWIPVMMVLLSPPFGRYRCVPGAVPVMGTYTPERRPGFWWRALRTVRPTERGWVNRVGLRNAGWPAGVELARFPIWSVAGLDDDGWRWLADNVPPVLDVEANISCVNTGDTRGVRAKFMEALPVLKHRPSAMVKMSPLTTTEDLRAVLDHGVRWVHLCNTLQTAGGGLSGPEVREMALPLVEAAAGMGLHAVGGGGVYSAGDVRSYRDAGAEGVSVCTVLLVRPWAVPSIMREARGD